MKQKQRNPPHGKKGTVEPLNVSDLLPDKLPLSLKGSRQETGAADKQGIERGKERAKETTEKTLSAVKKAVRKLEEKAPDKTIENPIGQSEKTAPKEVPLQTQGKNGEEKESGQGEKKPKREWERTSERVENPASLRRTDLPPRQQDVLFPMDERVPRRQQYEITEKTHEIREKAEREIVNHERSMPEDASRTMRTRESLQNTEETVPEKPSPSRAPKKEETRDVPQRPRRSMNRSGDSPEGYFGNPRKETLHSASTQEKCTFRKSERKEGRTMKNVHTRQERTVKTRDTENGSRAIKTSGREKELAGEAGKSTVKTADTAQKAAEAGKTAQEAAQAAGQAAQTAGEAAGGASSAGISVAVKEALKKSGESFRAMQGKEASPMGNDHSSLGVVFQLSAGCGSVLLMTFGVFLLPLLIAAVLLSFGSAGNQNLSEGVIALLPQIQAACVKYEIPDYAPLAAAIMMQESGGDVELVHGDVMQCAEGMGLPVGTPVTPEESIDFGVKLLKGLLQQAGVTSPADLDHLKLAVQAYNFGSGYIGYALAMDGKYTRENAVAFAQRQAGILGWSSYGDVDYVDHVLRYYTIGSVLSMGAASQRYPTLCYPMPGYTWTTYGGHEGIDLPCELGTPVYASGTGTVSYVKNGWTEADGKSGMMSYGNCVCISHGSGLETRYGHLSYAVVQSGQTVFQGQLIGYSGSTGNSTGPHMHFSIYENGNPGSGGYSNNAALAFPNERQ